MEERWGHDSCDCTLKRFFFTNLPRVLFRRFFKSVLWLRAKTAVVFPITYITLLSELFVYGGDDIMGQLQCWFSSKSVSGKVGLNAMNADTYICINSFVQFKDIRGLF